MKITYYNVRDENIDLLMNGSEIEIDQLLKTFSDDSHDIPKETFNTAIEDSSSISPLPINNEQKWKSVMQACIYCYCGKTATNKELDLGIQIITKLNKEEKKLLDLRFVFGTIAYLLIGFKLKPMGRSYHDSNAVIDLVEVVKKLLREVKSGTFIPICAHRDYDDTNKDQLVQNIDIQSIERMLNLINGIVHNSKLRELEVTFLQPNVSYKASLFVFPQIFIKYCREGNLSDFFILLDRHFKQMSQVLTQASNSKVDYKLKELDSFVDSVFKLTQQLFEEGWTSTKNWVHMNDATSTNGEIVNIAENITAPHVMRFMPMYGEEKGSIVDETLIKTNVENAKKHGYEKVVLEAISWFLGEGRLSLMGKSLYETMFYYYWGKISFENDFIGLGFERDHDVFQVLSWGVGYSGEYTYSTAIPLVYARRFDSSQGGEGLNKLSFRQFWRNSI